MLNRRIHIPLPGRQSVLFRAVPQSRPLYVQTVGVYSCVLNFTHYNLCLVFEGLHIPVHRVPKMVFSTWQRVTHRLVEVLNKLINKFLKFLGLQVDPGEPYFR